MSIFGVVSKTPTTHDPRTGYPCSCLVANSHAMSHSTRWATLLARSRSLRERQAAGHGRTGSFSLKEVRTYDVLLLSI